MKLAVLTETEPTERRVAVVPDVAKRLIGAGWEVTVQAGAGDAAWFTDDAYRQAGTSVAADPAATLAGADVLAKVQPLGPEESALVPEGTIVVSFLQPAAAVESLRVLAGRRATALSFDLLPRISRAQSMDALSSQATVSGYRAGLWAAEYLDKFFPMFMTAAGTVPPAKVLVMGAGVAGLQAIATVRRLGAVVRAYDVRAAAKEEAESVGATFVDLGVSAEGTGGYARELSDEELARQQEALAAEVAASDVVIATAAVPGRPAPRLVTGEMVDGMAPGSLVIDLAADSGGNCEVTVAGEVVERSGTRVVGMANPPAGMSTHASLLFSRNVANLLALMVHDGVLAPDWSDEILAGTCVLRDGRPTHGPTAELLGMELAPAAPAAPAAADPTPTVPMPSGRAGAANEGTEP
ncbi:MAG: NAD(P) transhydrogenase subunit alpha [Acidimicrobiales bacterium]